MKQRNDIKEEKTANVRQDPQKPQIKQKDSTNSPEINISSNIKNNTSMTGKINTDKSNNTQLLQATLQSTVLQSSPAVTSKGRVESFKENTINRKIPVSLQRDVYRQIVLIDHPF